MELLCILHWIDQHTKERYAECRHYINRVPHFCADCKLKWNWTIFYERDPKNTHTGYDIHRCLNCFVIEAQKLVPDAKCKVLTAIRQVLERCPELGLES